MTPEAQARFADIEQRTRENFHRVLVNKDTGRRLDQMIADGKRENAREAQRDAPHPCCATFAAVVTCIDGIDTLRCPLCDSTFSQPCADTQRWNPEPVF